MMRWALAMVFLAVFAGCPSSTQEELARKKVPAVKVQLPESPEMVEPRRIERYVDGSYTILGLIKNQRNLLNTDVKVKGYIKQIVTCDEADDQECDLPDHAVLVDEPENPRRRVLIIGGEDTAFNELVVGKATLLEGRYRQTDPDGLFVRMEGLLILPPKPITPDPEVPEPSGP